MSLEPCDRKNEGLGRRIILLVEDEPFVRQATCSILQRTGFEVRSAEDAQEAMNVYLGGDRKVGLVLTYMVLPGKSGEELEACPRVRTIGSGGAPPSETVIIPLFPQEPS
jgi:CheY-like chemotaxis protein